MSISSLARKAARLVLPEGVHRRLKARMEYLSPHDRDVRIDQLTTALVREAGLLPLPPKHLQVRVIGGYFSSFIESGYRIIDTIDRVLALSGKRITDFPSVLDFGCGCGRVLRAMRSRLPSARLFGADIDGEAIEWLQSHYPGIASFSAIPHIPPTEYEASSFDLVYGISVFTHLPEDLQFSWLQELKRITREGGYLVLSTHGEKHYEGLDDAARRTLREKGFHYFDSDYGKSINLPDFYQTAIHTRGYVEREWGRYFRVLGFVERGLDDHQDLVLLQKVL